MTKREHERLAILETKMGVIETRTESMDGKIDILVEAHNKQRGFISGVLAVATAVGSAIGAGLVLAWEWFTK